MNANYIVKNNVCLPKVLRNKGYVAVVGSINMDIFGLPEQDLIERDSSPGKIGFTVGGIGQNIAQNLSHLGVEVYLITAYGKDHNGKLLKQACKENKVNLEYSEELENENTSTYLCVTDQNGDMLVAINDMKISNCITPEFLADKMDFINQAEICVVDAGVPQETIEWLCDHCTVPICGDPASVAKAERFENVLDKLTIFKPNALEASILTGVDVVDGESAKRAAEILLEKGVQEVYISLGKLGIVCANKSDSVLIPCVPTKVVNTTGAGDCGMAAIVWSKVCQEEFSLEETGKITQAASSINIESPKSVEPSISVDKILWKSGILREIN